MFESPKSLIAHRCRKGAAKSPLSMFAVAQMKKALTQTPLMSALRDAEERVSLASSLVLCLLGF